MSSAELFLINGRHQTSPFHVASLDDFTLTPLGQVAFADLLAAPNWSLYAIDLVQNQVMLVEMQTGNDLSDAAVVHQMQFTHAMRAAIIELDSFVAACDAIAPPRNLSFLFSTGRCGSTLTSRILAKLPDVFCLSEPDYLTNIAMGRLHHPRADLVALIRAATLFTCHAPTANTETIVIKPRNEATVIADLCHQAFPTSRNVFLYRDLLGWADSMGRISQRTMDPAKVYADTEYWRATWDHQMVGQPIATLKDYLPPDHGPVMASEFFTMAWNLRINGYLKALRRGMTLTAIHFTDLKNHREEETARLLSGCGLDPRHLPAALRAFESDSHRGSVVENETPALPMPRAQKAQAVALLARLGQRDYVKGRLP